IDAPDGHRHHVSAGPAMSIGHHLVARILACPYDQPRFERPSGDHEWIVGSRVASTDELNDLQLVSSRDRDVLPIGLGHNRSITFHGHPVFRKIEMIQKLYDI